MFHSRRAWEFTVALADRSGLWLDVGAGHGHYTVRMARVADRVAAFEAHEGAVQHLEQAVVRMANVSVVNAALTNETGMVELWTDDRADWGQAHTLDEARVRLGGRGHRIDRHHTVQAFSLDDWVGFMGEGPIRLVKIDAPASELQIIEGARSTLISDRPLLSFRVYPPTDGEKLFALLTELGYAISNDGINEATTITVDESDQGWVAWPRIKE